MKKTIENILILLIYIVFVWINEKFLEINEISACMAYGALCIMISCEVSKKTVDRWFK